MRVFTITLCAFAIATFASGQQNSIPSSKFSDAAISGNDATAKDARPEHPITPQQVHEILQLTNATQLSRQVTRVMLANMEKTFPPYFPKPVLDEIRAALDNIDLEPMAVAAYQKHISTEDADQIIAFYKTPTGRRLTVAMPAIAQEMQESGARWGVQAVQEIIQKHMDEIRAAALKYHQQQPDIPTITSPN